MLENKCYVNVSIVKNAQEWKRIIYSFFYASIGIPIEIVTNNKQLTNGLRFFIPNYMPRIIKTKDIPKEFEPLNNVYHYNYFRFSWAISCQLPNLLTN